MENLSMTNTDTEIHIEGFPDAVKVIRIDGPKSKRLAALSLHNTDLVIAAKCLEMINQISDSQPFLKQMLWLAANYSLL